MRVMIMNGSPKKKMSASRYIEKTLKLMFVGAEVIESPMHTKADIPEAVSKLDSIDALIIAAPLYVDGIPSNVLRFLKKVEEICQQQKYHFKVYVVSNNGFIEGHQNEVCLGQYECWAERCGIEWGGGIGIGGGTILAAYTICIPIALVGFVITAIQNIAMGLPAVNAGMALGLAQSLGWFLFFSSSMFICEALLVHRVKKQQTGKNLYGRFMCPAIIFLIGADIFMLLLCIVKGGIFRNIFHRVSASELEQ